MDDEARFTESGTLLALGGLDVGAGSCGRSSPGAVRFAVSFFSTAGLSTGSAASADAPQPMPPLDAQLRGISDDTVGFN